MFKPGAIRKIQVKNFVTYSQAELIPGPNLNMIIGPNGTGKSTMVAAIILGLGGTPKIVGRGSKISEYVKHDCEEAEIDILLQGDTDNKFIQVTRRFNTHEKSVWLINNKVVKLGDLLDSIKKFNIQVNNLCQFLPQDRVQDFAKLNKQQLLKETQIALCRQDLLENQETLIECREQHKKMLASIEKNEKELKESKEANSRLEGLVKNFNQKKVYLEKIQHIERKIAWIMYDNIRVKLQEAKNDKVKASQLFETSKAGIEPIEKQITGHRESMQDYKQKALKISKVMSELRNSLKESGNVNNKLTDAVAKIESDAQSKIAESQERKKEIELSKSKLNELREAHQGITVRMAEMEQQKRTYTVEVQKLITAKDVRENKREEIVQARESKLAEMQALDNEIQRLEDVKQDRLRYLQRLDKDAYQATMWLRNNRHIFKSEVYDPIMLEINVLDPKNAIYLENVIPLRDRVAFTCVDKSDMNLLIQQVRTKQNLKINVLHSESGGNLTNEFQPNVPIEQLTKYGLYSYLYSMFTAPDPIMKYLCKTYRVHNIPVGNAKTNQLYEKIPPQISMFYSDKYKYSITQSKYSGEKSTRQLQVYSDGGLSISVDVVKLEKIKGQRKNCQSDIATFDDDLKTINSELTKYNECITVIKGKLKEVSNSKYQADTLQTRITSLEAKIAEKEEDTKDANEILEESKVAKKKVIQKYLSLMDAVNDDLKKFTSLQTKWNLANLAADDLGKKIVFLENSVRDKRRVLEELGQILNKTKDHYSSVMSEAKTILNKAKSLSNGLTPDDEGFKEFQEEFDKLDDDLPKLTEKKLQINSKIACLNSADDGEMAEYADREKHIEHLDEIIQKHNSELTKINNRMSRIRDEWITPLNELIGEINLRFSQAFERMGCAGEVSLYKGENEMNFSDYGITIKVTYRNNVPLQELNTTVQSGGERAVATATFMLSLQELTPVPFRCVDEINQGMDANNERRIFELLVDSTGRPNTAQYFLITPKLVPHLKYSNTCMVHTVHNGPFIERDKKWSFSTLCNPQGFQCAPA